MSAFENQQKQAMLIEKELLWRLGVLGIDWQDESQLKKLAIEAVKFRGANGFGEVGAEGADNKVRVEVYGLIGLMLASLEEAAVESKHVAVSEFWSRLVRALTEAG